MLRGRFVETKLLAGCHALFWTFRKIIVPSSSETNSPKNNIRVLSCHDTSQSPCTWILKCNLFIISRCISEFIGFFILYQVPNFMYTIAVLRSFNHSSPVVTVITTIVQNQTILRSAHTVYLCVLCGSQNKQRLFPYTTLTDWFI